MKIFKFLHRKEVSKTPLDIHEEEKTVKKSNKRKTIPKEIKEILKSGNDEEVKKIMSKCQINAYDTFTKNTILSYDNISDSLVRYFVQEQGYDINFRGRWDGTPLHDQASNVNSNIALFIELGADIHACDYMDETPLHKAAMMCNLNHIKALIEAGAKVNQMSNVYRMTPLHELVVRMHLHDCERAFSCIDYLLKQGAKITPQVRKAITKIGEDFEFQRPELEVDTEEMERNLHKLYAIFDVEPVPKRVVYDNQSLIVVTAKRWQDQHQELWKLLVPGSGHAKTVQGEVIRIAGRLSYEILDNGAGNWDHDFRQMVKSLPSYYAQGKPFLDEEMKELKNILSIVGKGKGDEELKRLTELSVTWVLRNPSPISLQEVNYKR